jgi:type VI secretion system protein ImpJ
MYLGPHHFQTQAAYFESAIHFASSALWFEPYGFLACELDAEALRNGTASLVHARGVFPDGMAFQMPECDTLPAARPIADLFPPTRDRLTLSLGVPASKPNGANCALHSEQPANGARFLSEERRVYDENTGLDEKSVNIGRKNIRIVLDTEPTEDLLTLPLARVLRDGFGHYIYDERFIPPCLEISANDHLMTLTRRLIEILTEKSATVSSAGAGRKFAAGMSAQQVASFWFLHALNSALAPLRHICFSRHGHPEQLYSELLRLGGALCTFGLDSNPAGLPLYNHLNLEECFEDLDRHIREHLEMLAPSNCLSIPLSPAAKYFYRGAITDSRCFGRSRWIFGMSGLALSHLPVPPAAISPKLAHQYFAVTKSGPCWDHITDTKEAGVYVPGDIPNAEVELLVVLDT